MEKNYHSAKKQKHHQMNNANSETTSNQNNDLMSAGSTINAEDNDPISKNQQHKFETHTFH